MKKLLLVLGVVLMTGCATHANVAELQTLAETCQGKVQFRVQMGADSTRAGYTCEWENEFDKL